MNRAGEGFGAAAKERPLCNHRLPQFDKLYVRLSSLTNYVRMSGWKA